MKRFLSLTILILLAGFVSDAIGQNKGTTVTILAPRVEIPSAHADAAVAELVKVVNALPGAKVVSSSVMVPLLTVEIDLVKTDVGDLARAMGAVKAAGLDLRWPAAALVVQTGLKKDDGEKFKDKLRAALANVKGVKDAQWNDDHVLLMLDEKGGAKHAEIMTALKTAGVGERGRR